ncbi:MAG: thymidine phosphorylase [Pikeienuella sp.]
MIAQEIIRKKRDGHVLAEAEISEFISGLSGGSVSEAQAAAFAMAVLLKGMSEDERIALTVAMRDSGERMEWDLPGPVVDKHSTGGVGDNVSLMLAPALAACGVYVPMISGRGLGHTGGTLDKLAAIPNYDPFPSSDNLMHVVETVGCAIIGQTEQLAPADRRLYAIRDVTGTVESVDLITASILSKKLAAGLDALVLDVKCGNGAFMATQQEAGALTDALVSVANGAGCRTSALMTNMDQPLCSAAGNALEVENAVAFLTGEAVDQRVWDVTVALGAELLTLSGICSDNDVAVTKIVDAFQSGRAAEKFGTMTAALGGPRDIVEKRSAYLEPAPIVRDVFVPEGGVVSDWATREVGLAVIDLGGGRRLTSDTIDHRVGFDRLAAVGEAVGPSDPIGRVHAATESAADEAALALSKAVTVGAVATETGPLITRWGA